MEFVIASILIEVSVIGIAILCVRLTGRQAPGWVPFSKHINRFAKPDKKRLDRLAASLI